ncbi:uncharacterized protein LOC144905643 [Branchiostoma floridae x Branchiostoma belcheri]
MQYSYVREHFYLVKEEVSSDWKDLAFHLGFGRPDTDNIAGRNPDEKSRCMDLLEEWLKRNGERATIEVLMKALSEANLQSTVDKLNKTTISVSNAAQPQSSQRESNKDNRGQVEQGLQIKHVFQESVKGVYEMKLTKFKPLIWNDNFTLTLGDIFTELELIRTKQRRQERNTKLHSLDDLFKRNVTGLSTAPRCILIEGEAGGGKTTFLSKEALDAVSQKTELGRRHDIVLLIRLREVREGETVEEMVWDQCVPETTEGVYVQSIRAILQRSESRVLFLLDGYDELRPEARAAGQAIPKLLSGKMYPNSTTVITSRPSAGVQQYTQPDCHVHIMGFSPKHMVKYVRQYFSITENSDLANGLITILNENQPVTDLIHTPIFLMLVCLLWEENPDMVSQGTMTGVYSDLLMCLGRKHCKREGVDMPTDGLPGDIADALLQLGKLALGALLRNETLLDIESLPPHELDWELPLKLGVVSLEVSASKLHPRKQLNFSHRTMQEFLAGRYLAHALANQDIVELLQLPSIHRTLELRTLLQFTCGCGSQAAQVVLEDLITLSRKEFADLRPEHLGRPGWQLPEPVSDRMFGLAETYRQFGLLCLDILSERKELAVLNKVRKAMPIFVLWHFTNRKRQTAFRYYLDNIQSLELPERMMLRTVDLKIPLGQYMEETFIAPIPGLRLDLSSAMKSLPPEQAVRLISALKNVPDMRALDLTSRSVTPSSLQPLVRGFQHIPLLEELDVSCSGEFRDVGVIDLSRGLTSVPHLAVLRLSAVSMSWIGMIFLAIHLPKLAGLRELDISVNTIGNAGLVPLAAILPTLTNMQVLILWQIGISSAGVRTLVPALRKLHGLIKLDVSDNPAIGDIGLECLTESLFHLMAMRVLVLSEIGISDKGISSLVKVLPHLVQLQVLDVGCNNIGDFGIVSLVQTLCQTSNVNTEQTQSGDKSLTNSKFRELHMGNNTLPKMPILILFLQ